MRAAPRPTARGVAVLALATVLVAAGWAADQVVVLLWGAVPLALAALDRGWAVIQGALLHPPPRRRLGRPTETALDGGHGGGRGLALWWDDAAGPVGGPVGSVVPLTLRHALPAGTAVRGLAFRPTGSSALTFLPERAAAEAPSGAVPFQVAAAHVGSWFAHGVVVTTESPLGLFRLCVYRPVETRVRTWPRPAGTRLRRPFAATRASLQEGAERARRAERGLGAELRELRDHAPGDPFKHIAWKASARTRRLIVKEFETELTLSVYLAVDLSPPMRTGTPGGTPLDVAVDVAWTLLTALARGRDRVGFVAFDTRVLAFQRAAPGRKAFTGIAEELLAVHQRVDEDLTAVTFGELLVRVADFLERQRGLSLLPAAARARRPRSMPDPGLVLGRVEDELTRVLPAARAGAARELARDADAARLRLFCREHGVELPYRPTCSPSDRARGLLAAFERVVQAGGGPHVLVVLTDLETAGVSEDALVRAVRLARAHRNPVVVLVARPRPLPGALRSEPSPSPPLAAALTDLYEEDDRQRREAATLLLQRAGATVVPVTEAARLPNVLRHLQRAVR
jgi:uncharacterized protein (DUF58 family)